MQIGNKPTDRKAANRVFRTISRIILVNGACAFIDVELSSRWIRSTYGIKGQKAYDIFIQVVQCTDEAYAAENIRPGASFCKKYSLHMAKFNELRAYLQKDIIDEGAEVIITPEEALDVMDSDDIKQLTSGKFEYKLNTNDHRHHHWLQNVKSELRSDILVEYGFIHDYDISAAVQNFMINDARENDEKIYAEKMAQYESGNRKYKPRFSSTKLQAIAEYAVNSKAIRDTLVNDTGVPLHIIKQIITALGNGGRMNIQIQNRLEAAMQARFPARYGILMKENGGKFPRISTIIRKYPSWANWDWFKLVMSYSSLERHPFIAQFKKDLSKFWTKFRKANHSDKMSPSTKSKEYFKFEFQIREAIIKFNEQNSIFLIHDGFVSKTKIDVNQLIEFIKQETGHSVEFKHTELVTG